MNAYERFLQRHSSIGGAKEKIREIFNGDWQLDNSRFMSTLSELLVIELLSLKSDMVLTQFDALLNKTGKNADVKLSKNGKEVYLDVKSPTLTDDQISDAAIFRAKFEDSAKSDFIKKFSDHTANDVERVLAYVYKYKNDLNHLFQHGKDHLRSHIIQLESERWGIAKIYWIALIKFEDQSRGCYLLDQAYSEQDLIDDLNEKNKPD